MTEKTDQELAAMSAILNALVPLDQDARSRVVKYVFERLGIESAGLPQAVSVRHPADGESSDVGVSLHKTAEKWVRRTGLAVPVLRRIFALDTNEPDLLADHVPGDTKKKKMRNILLLLGVGQYLVSGETRFSDATLRAACRDYDAYDGSNFSAYLRDFESEVVGGKDNGFSLTARGIASAVSLIKSMGEVG